MNNEIEKTIQINAPIEKVWHALTNHQQFSEWFLVKLDGPFRLGDVTSGSSCFPGHEGKSFWTKVIRMEQPNYFSFRWPYAEEIGSEFADDPSKTTLVEFHLESSDEGTSLTVKESGFDSLPNDKRLTIFRDNTSGWNIQSGNIKNHAER
ncbi:MAG: SRPBCC family protein [Acidiferrobacterales bacterium]|nr:SRPBCC family protein [Acidiferrobacterales bacterium]